MKMTIIKNSFKISTNVKVFLDFLPYIIDSKNTRCIHFKCAVYLERRLERPVCIIGSKPNLDDKRYIFNEDIRPEFANLKNEIRQFLAQNEIVLPNSEYNNYDEMNKSIKSVIVDAKKKFSDCEFFNCVRIPKWIRSDEL